MGVSNSFIVVVVLLSRLISLILKGLVKVTRKMIGKVLLVMLLVVLVFGLIFHFVEGVDVFNSLYWALVTSSTVGYGDITPRTYLGKLVSMVLIVVGVAVFSFFVGVATTYISSFEENRLRGLVRVNWSDHVVIIGWSETVQELITELRANNPSEKIVLVAELSEVPPELRDLHNFAFVSGDPTKLSVLERAGVSRARYVIVCTGDDARNSMVVLLVRKLNTSAVVIAEVSRKENCALLKQAGANYVIVSQSFIGRLLASYVFEPGVAMFFEDVSTAIYGNDVIEVPSEKFVGKSCGELLMELKSRYNATLIGIRRGCGVIVNPKLDEVIKSGDSLILLVDSVSKEKLLRELRG